MNESEMKQIIEQLNQCATLLSKPRLSSHAVAEWVQLLKDSDYQTISHAVNAHKVDPDRGRFMPKPADISAQIFKVDPWPTDDEAWAIALQGQDESETVYWTNEIAKAWGVARNVMPDRTGARMAFKSSYSRLLVQAKREGRLPDWYASLGTDSQKRELAMEQALSNGLIEQKNNLAIEQHGKETTDEQAVAEIKKLSEKVSSSEKSDPKAWARRIVANPQGRSHISLEMAKAALGLPSSFERGIP